MSRLLVAILVAITAGVGPLVALAQESATPHYRRVLVPEELLQDLGRGFRLMSRDEFQRRLHQLQVQAQVSSPRAVRIDRASYRARLQGDQLVDGSGTWTVSKEETLSSVDLVLGDINLPVTEARWLQSPPVPAALGLRASGELVLRVEQAADLAFAWSLRGSRTDRDGSLEFQFRPPNAMENRVELELPADLRPVVESGVIEVFPEEDLATTRRWSWEFQGNEAGRLMLLAAHAPGATRPPTYCRTDAYYDIRESGAELRWDLRLMVGDEPLSRIDLALGRALHVMSLTLDDEPLSWEIDEEFRDAESEESNNLTRRLRVEFKTPLSATNRFLQLRAITPLTLDQEWELPGCKPARLLWQSGTTQIQIAPPLSLQQMDLERAHQVAIPDDEKRGGEPIRMRLESPDARLIVRLSEIEPRMVASVGTTLHITSTAITAQGIVELSAKRGRRFALLADLREGWLVDGVETVPAELFDDYELTNTSDPQLRQLRVAFREAIRPDHPVKVLVRAHRNRPAEGTSLAIDDLRLLRPREVSESRRLIAVHTDSSVVPELTGDLAVHRYEPDEIGESERALLEIAPTAIIFADDSAASRLRLQLGGGTPGFSAQISVSVAVDTEQVHESYRVRCRPESSQVSRLLVHSSLTRTEPLNWSAEGTAARGMTARRLSQAEQRTAGVGDGEVWEISFSTPLGAEFELVGERSLGLADRLPIALLSLPEATSQTGTIHVESNNPRIRLESTGLYAIPSRATDTQTSDMLGAFRYRPAHGGRLDLVRDVPWNLDRNALLWDLSLTTWVGPTGQLIHTARCRIESFGAGNFEVRLPPGTSFRRMSIQGRPVVPPAAQSGVLDIPIAADSRFIFVAIEYEQQAESSANAWLATANEPMFRVPVMFRGWRLKTAPGLLRIDSDQTSWWERWIAVLGLGRSGQSSQRPDDSMAELPTEQVADWWDDWVASKSGRAPSRRWSDIVESLENWVEGRSGRLRIDWRAMARHGIAPQSPFPDISKVATASDIVLELRRHELRLAVRGPDLFLISMHPGVEPRPSDVMPSAAWRNLTTAWRSPWADGESVDCELADEAGDLAIRWNSRRQPHRWVIDATAERTTAFSLLFSAWAATWWMAGRAPRLSFALILVTAAALQVAPVTWIFRGSAVMIGSILAFLFMIRWQPLRMAMAPRAASLATLLLVVLSASLPPSIPRSSAIGQEKVPRSAEFRLLEPVDENRNPVGDYVYLSAEFDRYLHTAEDSDSASSPSLLQKALYRGTFLWDDSEGRLELFELTAIYNFDVQTPNEIVRIPLASPRLHLLPGKSTLDGSVVDLEWDAEGQFLLLPVESPGHHQLQLRTRPAVRVAQEQLRVELMIPRTLASRIELTLPRDRGAVQLPTALGAIEFKNGQLAAELGPTGNLVVQWPQNPREPLAEIAVEELQAITVGSQSTKLDLRLRLTSGKSDQLRSVGLRTDPRLRLLPFQPNPFLQSIKTAVDDPHLLQLELRFTAGSSTVDLPFEIAGSSSVGSLYFPTIEIPGAKVVRRLAGVACEPPLVQLPGPKSPVADTVRGFELAWGDTVPQIHHAYRLPLSGDSRRVETRLPPRVITANERMELGVAIDTIRVEWSSAISADMPEIFQVVVAAPEALQIANVSIVDQGETLNVPWSRGKDGTIYVRPNRPLTENILVEIQGQFPRMASTEWEIPPLRTLDANRASQWLNIYRQSDVMVDLVAVEGYEPQPDIALGEFRDGWGRLCFQSESKQDADGNRHPIRLRVSPNRPYAASRSITTMERRSGKWHALFDYRLQVRDGVMDALRLEFAEEWNGPFVLQPALAYEIATIPGQSRRQLIIRPPRAIAGEFHLRIDSPITITDDEPDGVPEVLPLDVDKLERFVVVPTVRRQQELRWDIRGLQSASLPEDAPADIRERLSIATYQVVSPRFQATIEEIQRTLGESRVNLARFHTHFRADGTAFVAAALEIDPAGMERCRVELPDGAKLVFAAVDGRAPRFRASGLGQWEIEFASAQLAQSLQLLYELQLPSDPSLAAEWQPPPPKLAGIPIERVIETVSGTAAVAESDGASIPLSRLHAMNQLLEQADEVASEHTITELSDWLSPWAHRFLSLDVDGQLSPSVQRVVAEQRDAVSERIRDYESRHKLPTSLESREYVPSDMVDICRMVVAAIDGPPNPHSVGVRWTADRASESTWTLDLPRGLVSLACLSLGTLFFAQRRIRSVHAPRLAAWPFVLAAIGIGTLLIGSNPWSGATLVALAFFWSIGQPEANAAIAAAKNDRS